MTALRGVLLDFYGTLVLEDDAVVASICRRIADSVAASSGGRQGPSTHEVGGLWWRAFRDACAGHGAGFVTQRRAERLSLEQTLATVGSPLDPAELEAEMFAYWRAPDLFDDTRPFLDRLRLAGVPVCLVSDIDRDDLEAALAHHGLVFDGVVTSEDVRAYKPRGEGFRAGLGVLGLPSDDVAYVGNSWSSDVVGARRAGIRAAWVNRDGRPVPDDGVTAWRVVTGLAELPGSR